MATLIKKVLYTGVGLVANTTEKVQQTVNNFVDKDGEYQKEGKRILGGIVKTGENRRENMEDKAKDIFGNVMARFDLVSKSDYDTLVKKINKLEKGQKATVKSAGKTKTKSAKTKSAGKSATKTSTRKYTVSSKK